jgi:EF-P beta-lysylation protein EpmB
MTHSTLKIYAPAQTLPRWKRELADAISSCAELMGELELDAQSCAKLCQDSAFKLKVPRAYVANMRKADRNDPLLLQVLPRDSEDSALGLLDPVGDLDAMVVPGLLHKYHGRVLLMTTGACAIHCRYCFRRNFPYSDATLQRSNWQPVLDYIAAHDEIEEVILSGGDPLVLDDDKLDHLQQQLAAIAHVKWLRVHSRLPVVLPSRVDDRLLAWMQASRLRITLVIHANHANELSPDVATALQQLQRAGVGLLNQSVLLKGINDSAAALIALSRKLHECGVLPYYLHMLDATRGAMHFAVDVQTARQLMANLQAKLPGYLVPRLVVEEAGKTSKTAISVF